MPFLTEAQRMTDLGDSSALITIVDYGTSNLGSIQNMIRKIGGRSVVASRPEQLRAADKIIIPGVGAFDAGMRKLTESGMVPVLNRKVLQDQVPVLGVCLGMQLMTRGSHEGELEGLGWVPAFTRRFDGEAGLRVPHMGWNLVRARKQIPLLASMPAEARFYFAHSYCVACDDPADVLLETDYGPVCFTSGFQRANILGAQFHPEKSHRFGMWLLRNFMENY
jgi:imidazole glycerol-phosphate synthase subunit HisH